MKILTMKSCDAYLLYSFRLPDLYKYLNTNISLKYGSQLFSEYELQELQYYFK